MSRILLWAMAAFALGVNTDLVKSELSPAGGLECLQAIVKIAQTTPSELDLAYVHSLLRGDPHAATDMKALKRAAERLGFRAEERRLTPQELKALAGYAIIPLEKTSDMTGPGGRYYLVAGANREDLLAVDAGTVDLDVWGVTFAELKNIWKGKALLIPSRADGAMLPKPDIRGLGQTGHEQNVERKIVTDLGKHETGEAVTRSVPISDAAGFLPPYLIKGKNCGCVSAKLGTDPNGTASLTVQFKVSKAGLQAAIVLVGSETSKLLRAYEFRAHGKEAVKTYPVNGYFRVKSGLEKYPVSVKYFTIDKNADAVFERMEADMPGLTCAQAVARRRSYDGKLTVFTFEVLLSYHLGDKQRRKTFSGKVNFVIGTSDGPRFVPFELTIVAGQSEYRLVPEKLFLLCSRSSSDALNKVLRLKLEAGQEVKALSISQSGSLPIKVEAQRKSKQEYILRVSVVSDKMQNLSLGTMKGEVIVKLDGPEDDKQIVVPVTLVICK